MFKKNQKGYTLVETMASVGIGLLIISSVGSTLDAGIFAVTDSRSRLYATNALREELETIRRTAYDTVVAYGTNSAFTNAQVAQLSAGTATRTITDSFGADIKKVTLTVSWTSRRSQPLSQSITTYVSRRGLNGS